MQENVLLEILNSHLPPGTISYCYQQWYKSPFKFMITKSRASKLGDYRFYPGTNKHIITINGDLNKYSFLITYLHEVAHLRTNLSCGCKVKPHGKEWKNKFSELLEPLMERGVFPQALTQPIKDYMKNPKASSCTDLTLLKALKTFDEPDGKLYLSEIGNGTKFIFNKVLFIKQATKRTRALCQDLKTGRKYLVSEAAQVSVVED